MNLDPQISGFELPSGTSLLRGQYVIEQPLSQGGFGITYLARDSLKRRVVVKECFPQDLCTRAALRVCAKSEQVSKRFETVLEQFKEEAYRLAALDHPGIVRVHQVFEENGTAFLAMDYLKGEDLVTIVEDQPERLGASVLRKIVTQALEAVKYTHDHGILHRDLAPDNFILDENDKLTLIDFGSSIEINPSAGASSSKLLAVKDGYSPHEFYLEGAEHNEASDIYALGATFHYLITGYIPPDAEIRVKSTKAQRPDPYQSLRAVDWELEGGFLDLINTALNIHASDRLVTAEQWLSMLETGYVPRVTAKERQQQAEQKVEDAAPKNGARHGPTPVPDPRINAATKESDEAGQKQSTLAAVPPHDPTAIAIDTPEMAATISQLVSDTNSKFSPGLPQLLRQDEPAEETKKAVEETRLSKTQPVDMFGNPIEDVEAFLAGEEPKLTRKQKKAAQRRAAEDASGETTTLDTSIEEQADAGSHHQDETPDTRKGAMGRFFGKILPGKDSGEPVLQN